MWPRRQSVSQEPLTQGVPTATSPRSGSAQQSMATLQKAHGKYSTFPGIIPVWTPINIRIQNPVVLVCGMPKWYGTILITMDPLCFDYRRLSTVAHHILMIAQAPTLEHLQYIACVADALTPNLLSSPWPPCSTPSYSRTVPPKRAPARPCAVWITNFNCGIPWDLWGSDGIFGIICCPMPSSWPPRSVYVGLFNSFLT